MMLMILFIVLVVVHRSACDELPQLEIDGFAWAENLIFDALGGLFVSEAVRGELWKIALSPSKTEYLSSIYLNEGIKQFGGLAVSADGLTLYTGVVFDDKSFGIIKTATSGSENKYEVVFANLQHLPNGLALDEFHGVLYASDEGTNSDDGGTLISLNLHSKVVNTVKSKIGGADGLYIQDNKIFLGSLISKKIFVFDIDKSSGDAIFISEYNGLNSIGKLHLLDDITLLDTKATFPSASPPDFDNVMLLGADWTGKSIALFSLDGKNITTVPTPNVELKEPTSVRWGKGPGFDPDSIYVSEGGGITKRFTNRRVVQIKMR